MKKEIFSKFIQIDTYSATPKYLQLGDSIIDAVENGKLKKDDILPSINELSYILEISRDTAEKGYKYLKKIGVITSVPGKGYYIRYSDESTPVFRDKVPHLFRSKVRQPDRPLISLSKRDNFQT